MVDLKAQPFSLDDAQIKWVEDTISSMTLDEKVGQLFVLMRGSLDPEEIKKTVENYHQGGLRWQGGDREQVYAQNRCYQENSKIPMFVACNCDNGGDGVLKDGTFIATAAGAGASKDTTAAYYQGLVAGREASALGMIIDDLDDFSPAQHDRYVETNPIVGITEADAQKAIEILISKA